MSQSKRRVTVVQHARAFVAFSRDNDSDKGVQNTEPVKVQGTPTLNPTLNPLIDEGILNICDTYYKPPAIDKFYLSLEKEDVFTGMMHADAFLGSLLDNCTHTAARTSILTLTLWIYKYWKK